ncbi:MAG: MFS transporter [Fimbriimonadaceae bacterium]|nr:MFS transporter [Fimbriimonadaceae bacterium]
MSSSEAIPADSVGAADRYHGIVASPYTGKKLRIRDHLSISAFWFATNFHWGAMLILLLPNQVRTMVPEHRATVLGLLTGVAAIVALVVPLIAGALSDRCASPMGRRKPYILWGSIINVVGLGLMCAAYYGTKPVPIGAAKNAFVAIAQSPGLILYFFAYIVVQFGNNVATSAYSGFIPDLVEPHQRGIASGYMALMTQFGTLFGAIACGVLLGWLPESVKYGVIGLVLLVVMAITVKFVQEAPLKVKPPKIEWGPYVKSLWISPRAFPDFA